MKKILLLGGSAQQVVSIKTAKKLGYYTILCDYLEDNPGQYFADKFYLISTTDKEAVLEVAIKEQIQGILAYASDPAAPTAAYVAERLNLPGNPYESVDILCNKDKFRNFLKENDFNTPKAKSYSDTEKAKSDIMAKKFMFPIFIKPVDSSGSKGVSRIDSIENLGSELKYAYSISRCKRIIVEEYVDSFGYQVAGDGLSIDGELKFSYFANDHFNQLSKNPFVPISASFPSVLPVEVQNKINNEIQRLLLLLNMKTSTYNFDIRVDKNYNIFLMEIAPRSGGNYIPNVIKYATGVDLIECSVQAAMGEPINKIIEPHKKGYWAYYAVHSLRNGILKQIKIQETVEKKHIVEKHIISKPGDYIQSFIGANTALGVLIMKFDSSEEMIDIVENSDNWIEVELEETN